MTQLDFDAVVCCAAAWPWGLSAGLVLALAWLQRRSGRRMSALQGELDRALVAQQAALHAAAARGRFLAYLSHELRSTAAAMSGGTRLLLQDAAPSDLPRRDALLRALAESAQQLTALLDATLTVERQLGDGLPLAPAEHSLAEWWHAALAPLALAARVKGLTLHSRGPADARRRFDATRLAQVLANLVHNAIKYTPAGEVGVYGDWDGQRLRLTVTDTGPGIAPQERALVFEPYRRGRAAELSAPGAGLGLAICQQLVQAMSGTLRLESPSGGGCLFIVEVPLPEAAPRRPGLGQC